MKIEEAAARTQARIDSPGRQTVVGVNKHKTSEETEIDILKVDNTAVRTAQIEKLKRLREERDPDAAVERRARRAQTRGRGRERQPAAACVDAARAKATVGEISYGHGEGVRPSPGRRQGDRTGVYRAEVGTRWLRPIE